jgi:hypothetical protein
MTHASELRALADRAEAAQGADRELDGEISRAIGTPGWRKSEAGIWFHNNLRVVQVAPTASLDAAVSLVPEGFMWRLQCDPTGEGDAICERNAGDFGAIDARHTQTFAATPALALVAAALRARAEELTDE